MAMISVFIKLDDYIWTLVAKFPSHNFFFSSSEKVYILCNCPFDIMICHLILMVELD